MTGEDAMPTEEELADLRRRSAIAVANAKAVLKAGDRLRVTKCPGSKRWITFASWVDILPHLHGNRSGRGFLFQASADCSANRFLLLTAL